MKKLDWKALGQFVSVPVSLFTLIRDTLAKTEPTRRVIVVNATTIMVNLDVVPGLPLNRAVVRSHTGGGWVKIQIQRSKDRLYVNGRKVVLHLSEYQKGGKSLKGYELRDELTGKPVLNANVLDALYDHPHLIPEGWKKDEAGNIRFIFFWGTFYCYPGTDGLCIRFLYFDGSVWHRYYLWLDGSWDGHYFAALLANN